MYGNDVQIIPVADVITIGGKRIIEADNLGMNYGFTFQLFGKYSLIKSGYLKALFNVGLTQLEGKYTSSYATDPYGVRMPIFSIGTGIEIDPIGIRTFYPSITGMIRLNEIGGESFYHAGLDFFIVEPRFGYLLGFNLNVRVSKLVGLYLGTTYQYDNWLNKKTNEGIYDDPHVINFRDEASSTNGLTHDRRVVSLSFITGINFYLK